MTTLASFLISIVGSLATRVLLALGIGVVSYAAISTVINGMITQMQGYYNSMPAITLQLAGLGGAGDFFAMVGAAFTARVSIMAIKKLRLQ